MRDLRPIMVFLAVAALLGGCETLLESHTRVYVPLDETVWTSELAQPETPAIIEVAGAKDDRRAVVQFSEYAWVYLHFYPTPLEIIQPLLAAYGGRLFAAMAPETAAADARIVIKDFEMFVNPAYKGSQFAITLQFDLQLAGESQRITALAARKLANRNDRPGYQAAMHEAIGRAVAESRLTIGIILDDRQ